MVDFMNKVLSAQIKQADAMIEKHKVNIEILTKNASGVAEHPDVMQTIEDELGRMAHFDDVLKMLNEVTSNGVSDQLK